MADIKGIELASEIYGLEDTPARDTATTASQTATQAQTTVTQLQTTVTNLQSVVQQNSKDIRVARDEIGDISALETSVKSDLVSAINELLTPVNIPNENISLRNGVTANAARLADRLQVGKVQTGNIYFSNLSAPGLGGNSVVIIGSCSLRPTFTQSILGYDSTNRVMLRVLINTDGRIFIAESVGVVSGNNQINVPFTIIA